MAGSALESLFLRARDLDLAAGRWCALAVAVLAVVHGALVAPFVASAERRSAASSDLDRLTQVSAGLTELASEIRQPQAVVDEVMMPALEQLVGEIDGDLTRLAATHRSLKDFVAAQRGGGDAAASGTPPEAEPFHVENIDRILAIGEATTREDLLAALEPLVEERIAGPRFMDLGQLWKASARPRIEAGLDAVAARLTDLRSRAPAAPWEDLAEALVIQRRTVRDLVWAPPERPDWWSSGSPEEGTAGELVTLKLDAAAAEQLRQPLALDQLRAAFAKTEAALGAVAADVGRRRAELDPDGMAGGLAGLGLGPIAGVFPLVLGVVLAACFAAGARRRRELGFLTHLVTEGGEEPKLREWYSMTLGSGSSGRLVLLALAALAWIGLTAAQLSSVEPFQKLAAVAGGGGAAVLAAAAYALSVRRSLDLVLAGPHVTRQLVAPPPKEDDETLDWDTLRR